jgi:integrase
VRAIIAARLLASKAAQPGDKPFEIYDRRLPGFTLRVQPSGVRSYYARLGRNGRVALGKVGQLTPDEARERCEKILGNHAHNRPLMEGIEGAANGPTLGQFITDTFEPWLRALRPHTAAYHLVRVTRNFSGWYGRPMASITVADVEQFRTHRLAAGKNPTTVARDVAALAGVLSRAVKLGIITQNVVRSVERIKIDRTPKPRYLDTSEERRLRDAAHARDAKIIEARRSANRWRKEREHDPLPALKHYGDHLTPAVLVSMNTGLRRGELLALRWSSVELTGKNPQLTVEGSTAKSGHTRHIPLNTEAADTLKRWREECPDADRVFPIDTSFKSAWLKLLTRAKVTAFRWHDLRHHFASRLVQAGVPLNTVRDLLGHASMTMTLRYAHLAPDQKREAVNALIEARP